MANYRVVFYVYVDANNPDDAIDKAIEEGKLDWDTVQEAIELPKGE